MVRLKPTWLTVMRYLPSLFLSSCLLFGFAWPNKVVQADSRAGLDIPFSALNSDQLIQLNGLFGTQKLEFTLPNNWQITDDSWIDLSVTFSNLLDQNSSSLTISLNDLQVTSILLKDLAGQGKRIKLPGSFFVTGKNILTLEGVLHLPEDFKTNCSGWDNSARWATFNINSTLHIGFLTQPFPADLSSFPDSFLQPLDRYLPNGEDQTIFVLPDQPQPDDLRALSIISYYLGHQAGDKFVWSPQIFTETKFKTLTTINGNVIFINNQPRGVEGVNTSTKNGIGIFSSPWHSGKAIMVISDRDRQDGYTPAQIFGDWIRKVLLKGNVAYFEQTANLKAPAFTNTFTLEDLGYLDRTIRNIGKQNLIYRFTIPYTIDPTTADLSLEITHAPDLDLTTSSIAVVLNGFTVAAVLPATQNTRSDAIQISLPPKRLRPGINFLRLAFDLHLQDSSCEKGPDTIWATVFNSSKFELTTQKRTETPNLKDFPAAFDQFPGPTFVVPDQPDSQTLANVAKLAFTMGATSYYGNDPPALIDASTYRASNIREQSYILIGLPSKNFAIQDVNDFLPQPFVPHSDQLQTGYGVYLPNPETRASMGLIQMAPSPWNQSGIVMILSGTDSQGLNWAWAATLDTNLRSQFSGNLMIIGPNQGLASTSNSAQPPDLVFEQTPMVTRIPIIGKFLQKNGQSEEAIAVIAIALAGLITWVIVKVSPLLTRIEIRLKHSADPSDQERE